MIRGGIQLSLLMGPGIPVPVPREVVEALTDVQVRNSAREQDGFQLTFTIDAKSTLNTLLLLVGQVGPIVRVVIIATVAGTPHVLMDGLITDHDVAPDVGSGQSTLTVSGKDLSVAMDLIEMTGVPYPAMPREARVLTILAKYALLGVVPLVVPSLFLDVPIPVDRIPTHKGTDFAYLHQLAREVGWVFYVDPGPVPGTSVAYWGPEIKVGVPQPALNVNMDAHTNVETMSFQYDGQSATLPIVFIQERFSKAPIPIPIPGIGPLNPPLGAIPPFPSSIELMPGTAKMTAPQAIALGLARAAESAEAVRCSGTLDVLRYGNVLAARSLVGVRGAGQAFDGLYFVQSVTHRIRRGQYSQEFTLSRNGLVSTVPKVPA